MKTKNRLMMRPRAIWWGDKIHTSSAKQIDAKTSIPGHKAYQVEGKERPVLIIKETEQRHDGCRHFLVVNIGSKSYGQNATIMLKFRGASSFLQPPPETTSENLLDRFEEEIPEQDFRLYKQKLRALAMQSYQ